MGPVKAYRVVSTRLPSRCRYNPSCSQYALDALSLHGARRGGWLAVKRVGRCHPWGGGGIDPVPDRAAPNPRANVRSVEVGA